MGALDPSGLVGLEQLQAVLQPGEETWEVWEPFWQGSSRSANGCPLASLGEHLGPGDHVPLFLTVASWPNWEDRQEAAPCLSIVLVAASFPIFPPGLRVS